MGLESGGGVIFFTSQHDCFDLTGNLSLIREIIPHGAGKLGRMRTLADTILAVVWLTTLQLHSPFMPVSGSSTHLIVFAFKFDDLYIALTGMTNQMP